MNILITGGAGYIGSNLVPFLLAGQHQVTVLDSLAHGGRSLLAAWSSPNFRFVRGDIRDHDLLAAVCKGKDAVVHLAAIVGDPACARQPELAKAVNLEASFSLLDTAQRTGASRFVFASTCSNYGKMTDPNVFADERSELRPVSLYAETKVAMEKTILDPANTSRLSATALRFATVFGAAPRMRFDLTVNEFTMELLTKGKLQVFGEQFWRPYVHVRDAARAIAAVLQAPQEAVRNEVFNVGDTGQNYTKKMLVELIQPHAPGAVVSYVHKTEDPRDYRVSFAKIHKTLGFKISRTVPDGIAEVAQLIKDRVITDFDNPEYKN